MYFIALEGVTRYALNEAVKSCSRGGHGHEFFPNTVELRRECDRAQRPINDMARRIRLTEEQIRERREYERVQAAKTPEVKARVAETYARFCAGHQSDRPSEPGGLKLTPEQLADIPDAPSAFRRIA